MSQGQAGRVGGGAGREAKGSWVGQAGRLGEYVVQGGAGREAREYAGLGGAGREARSMWAWVGHRSCYCRPPPHPSLL